MNHTLIILIVSLSVSITASAQIVVVDLGNLEQAILQVAAAQAQVRYTEQVLTRLGDPATVRDVAGLAQTLGQLGPALSPRPEPSSDAAIGGESPLSGDPHGCFRPIEAEIPLANGNTTPRSVEDYRRFTPLQKAVGRFQAVAANTKERRNSLRSALRETTQALAAATSDAEVQKLKGVQAAQQAELANLSAEQAEAAAEVMVQQAAIDTDDSRQEQAEAELRLASLQSALRQAARYIQVDSRPVLIPDPKSIAH